MNIILYDKMCASPKGINLLAVVIVSHLCFRDNIKTKFTINQAYSCLR